MRFVLVLSFLGFAACMRPPAVAPYRVVAITGEGSAARFVTCEPTRDWIEEDLVYQCGEPERIVFAWRGEPNVRCHIYPTRDVYERVDRIAVCTAPGTVAKKKPSSGFLGRAKDAKQVDEAPEVTVRRVIAIFGMRE